MNLVKVAEEYLGKESLSGLLRQDKIELLIKVLAEQGNWELITSIYDQLEENNDRRYYSHQDFLSADEILQDSFSDDLFIPIRYVLKLAEEEHWLDIIYSDTPEGLCQLTTDSYLQYGLKKLTAKQREVFYLRAMRGLTTREVAERMGTSDRNIRKHYAKAVETLRAVLKGTEKEKEYAVKK